MAVRAPIGPKEGETAHTISHGKNPRIIKTASNSPQVKNHLFAFSPIVDRTSALIMALSIEEILSKSTKPETIKTIVNKSIIISIY